MHAIRKIPSRRGSPVARDVVVPRSEKAPPSGEGSEKEEVAGPLSILKKDAVGKRPLPTDGRAGPSAPRFQSTMRNTSPDLLSVTLSRAGRDIPSSLIDGRGHRHHIA